MFKKILIIAAIAVLLFLVIVALQPADYRVTRSAKISASQALVFAQINDFHKWEAWSPWAKLDPSMKTTFEGPPAGTGAIYTWAGDSKVGEGRMTLMESHPTELVKLKLEFLKPFPSTADTDFTIKPAGAQTDVTWSMSGKNNFVAKAFCLFMNMDKMIGGDFERGLASLKVVSETSAK